MSVWTCAVIVHTSGRTRACLSNIFNFFGIKNNCCCFNFIHHISASLHSSSERFMYFILCIFLYFLHALHTHSCLHCSPPPLTLCGRLCSSGLKHPGKLRFVFNVLELPACPGRPVGRRGLCTGWLFDLVNPCLLLPGKLESSGSLPLKVPMIRQQRKLKVDSAHLWFSPYIWSIKFCDPTVARIEKYFINLNPVPVCIIFSSRITENTVLLSFCHVRCFWRTVRTSVELIAVKPQNWLLGIWTMFTPCSVLPETLSNVSDTEQLALSQLFVLFIKKTLEDAASISSPPQTPWSPVETHVSSLVCLRERWRPTAACQHFCKYSHYFKWSINVSDPRFPWVWDPTAPLDLLLTRRCPSSWSDLELELLLSLASSSKGMINEFVYWVNKYVICNMPKMFLLIVDVSFVWVLCCWIHLLSSWAFLHGNL